MAYRYLYIDDLDRGDANGTILGLEANADIKIIYSNPVGDWEKEIDYLFQGGIDYQGIIFDLRLQDRQNAEGKFSKYSGAILAHSFREKIKSGDSAIKDIPLVLLSANFNLQKYFDTTGKDAFDLCISRDSLNGSEPFKILTRKLNALAEGYIEINNKPKELFNLLNIESEQLARIDERFQYKSASLSSNPTHDLAMFLIQDFLEKEGLVISENLLSARLGVDISLSEDWINLLEQLSICKYQGVFSKGWDRWWMFFLEDWWKANIGTEFNLKSISATERVSLIQEKYKLKGLVAAKKIEKARSDSFWVLCSGLKKPLDPVDGLIIAGQDDIFPWQEKRYVSYEAAINRVLVDEWSDVAPGEKNKLEQLKTIYSRERIRR